MTSIGETLDAAIQVVRRANQFAAQHGLPRCFSLRPVHVQTCACGKDVHFLDRRSEKCSGCDEWLKVDHYVLHCTHAKVYVGCARLQSNQSEEEMLESIAMQVLQSA